MFSQIRASVVWAPVDINPSVYESMSLMFIPKLAGSPTKFRYTYILYMCIYMCVYIYIYIIYIYTHIYICIYISQLQVGQGLYFLYLPILRLFGTSQPKQWNHSPGRPHKTPQAPAQSCAPAACRDPPHARRPSRHPLEPGWVEDAHGDTTRHWQFSWGVFHI